MFRWFEEWVDPFQPYDDTVPPPSTLGRFFYQMLWPLRVPLLLAMVFGGLAAIAEVLLFHYMQRLVDLLGEADPASLWRDYGTEILTMAFVGLLLRPIIEFLALAFQNQSYLTPAAALIRWRSHRRLLRQSLGFFQGDFAGRIAQRIIQVGPAVADSMFTAVDAIWYAIIYAVGAAVILAGLDWRLVAIFVAWIVAYVAIATYIVPRIGRASKTMSEARSDLTGRIVDSYTNIQTVKLFAHAGREDSYARDAIERTWKTFRIEMRLFTLMDLLLLIINVLLIAAICGVGIFLWQRGEIGIGAIAASTALVLRLSAMTGWIMWSLSSMFQNLGVAMEALETVSAPISLLDQPNAAPLRVERGAIRFDDVRYMYGREAGGIEALDLNIQPGERVGLIGRSGAGKSTLVNLLLRFYDLEAGTIRIDGQDISEVTQDSLRGQISVVTQDTALLHRSVMENVLYGRPDATPEEARLAAKRARALDFINDLSDPNGRTGFDAHVGERGVKLSGGQRQRVAIARAILKNAPILVLDEATSALDSEVEAEIQGELLALMSGKTVIAIAHRLSTIAHLDRIIVMDAGRLVESGTHAELLAKDGLYASFWKRQSGGFLGV